MGFWSSVGSFVGSVASGIGSAVKSVVGGIGSAVSGAASAIKNWLGLGKVDKYDPENASIDETIKVNELLKTCVDKYSAETTKYDFVAKTVIKLQYNSIINELKKINRKQENFIEEYIFMMFDKEFNTILNEISGVYSKKISETFSLNNNELLKILKLPAGNEKQEKIQNMAIETIETSYDYLIKTVDEFLKGQQKFITEKLEKYLIKIKNEHEKAIKETETILENINNSKSDHIKQENKYRQSALILEFLEGV